VFRIASFRFELPKFLRWDPNFTAAGKILVCSTPKNAGIGVYCLLSEKPLVFWTRIQILDPDPDAGPGSRFWTRIQILDPDQDSGPRSRFWTQIQILDPDPDPRGSEITVTSNPKALILNPAPDPPFLC